MPNIFVSYRREESSDVTGRIFDHLKAAFGEEHLFKDVDSIPAGTDFREVIRDAIQRCDALVVVMGDKWLEVKDATGRRRIDDPDDFVRVEVSSALDRNIPVIPVLVGGATIPLQESLPEPLRRLVFRNVLYVRTDPDFRNDVERLCRDLSRLLKVRDRTKSPASPMRRAAMIVAAVVVLLVTLAMMFKALQAPVSVSGDTVNAMSVTNVSIILKEYEKFQGKPLLDDPLRELIDRALAAAAEGKHRESIDLLEKVAAAAPLPAIFNNLGVEYAKVNNPEKARAAFAKAMEREPGYERARANRERLESAIKMAEESAPGLTAAQAISFEKSPVAAIVIEGVAGSRDAVKEVHIVESGTQLDGMYTVKYSLTPGSPTLVDPGSYDVLLKPTGGGTFVLARSVDVKDAQRVRINPNPMLGSILVEPLTRRGFPAIKGLIVVEAGPKGSRTILQQTDVLGVPLPIVPGRYDIQGETTDGADFMLIKDVQVKARQVARVQTDSEVAAFVVQDLKIEGAQIEAIYVLRAGANAIVAETKEFGRPMLVPPDESYDIAIKQPGGIARLRTKVIATRGEVTEIR